ncbi:MAG TPA: vWA domain-containing protein, partial [Marmoricola sp.]|nr:vWA domain-containing protein [Marmoricola sp.]
MSLKTYNSETDARVRIQVGGDRTGMGGSAVSNLQGVQLGIYSSSSSTTPLDTCTSDASGVCELVVTNPGGNRYWVKQISAPTNWFMNPKLQTNWVNGWGGDNPATVDYIFQTPKLYTGTTYNSGDVMDTEGDPNDSDGTNAIWQNSRDNKSLVQRCGIKVALLLDISGSVGSAGMVSLKAAADKMVDSLTGTPSQMAVFNFASHSPESGTSNHPTLVPVATTSQANAFKALYSGWTSGGGTNWDEALYTVSQAAATYDVVVMITDGKPTYWSNGPSGSGSTTRFKEIETGIFSANKLKNKGTRIMALGVGSGVSGDAKYNLAAISGPTAYNGSNASTADYFQAADYNSAGEALRQLALGNCLGSVSVVKHIVPQGNAAGNITGATPAGAGWKFDGSVVPPTNGVTINPTSGTTDVTSAVNFKLDYPGGVNSATVQVGEDLTGHTNYELFPVGSKNAVCKRVDDNSTVTVTNVGTNGFTVNAPSTAPITCNVYNQYKAPPAWELTKTSSVDSPPLAPGGTLTYTLHAKNTGTVAGTNLTATDDLTNVLNNATLVTPLAAGLSISGNTLTWN